MGMCVSMCISECVICMCANICLFICACVCVYWLLSLSPLVPTCVGCGGVMRGNSSFSMAGSVGGKLHMVICMYNSKLTAKLESAVCCDT